jgi:adenosylcobinamide-phosphate synthase
MVARMIGFAPASPVDPLLILLAAMAIDAVIGDPPGFYRIVPHPVALIGRLVGGLDRRLNRPARDARTLRLRGAVVVALVVGVAALVGWALIVLTRRASWGWAVEALAAAVLLAQRSLHDHVRAVALALETGGLVAGREAVRHIVGREPRSLDEHGVARAGVESLAENFGDGVVAPVFWYVLLGLPGMLACKAVNTLDSMIGHRTERHLHFGFAAARLDTAVNYVPARLAGVLICIAALIAPGCKPWTALRVMLRDAAKHRSVNAGWPEGAMAGALGLALAGPRVYGGERVEDAWIGDGRARVEPADIRRALYVHVVACLLLAGLVAAIAARHARAW